MTSRPVGELIEPNVDCMIPSDLCRGSGMGLYFLSTLLGIICAHPSRLHRRLLPFSRSCNPSRKVSIALLPLHSMLNADKALFWEDNCGIPIVRGSSESGLHYNRHAAPTRSVGMRTCSKPLSKFHIIVSN